MFTWLFYLAIGFALLDWGCAWKGWKIRLYIAKPATLICLILWTLQVTGWQGGMVWFGAALVLSLAGDVALMLNPRYFLVGLGAFLAAHLCYLVGFNQQPAPLTIWVVMVAVLVGISASRVYRLLRPGILKVPRGKRFLSAVLFYGLTLTLMLLSALLTLFKPDWQQMPAILAASGGILFYISDTLLGYDRFVNKVKHGQCYVHLNYHLGQIGLVSGAVLYFTK